MEYCQVRVPKRIGKFLKVVFYKEFLKEFFYEEFLKSSNEYERFFRKTSSFLGKKFTRKEVLSCEKKSIGKEVISSEKNF